jgi:putative ABC transport system permease protein
VVALELGHLAVLALIGSLLGGLLGSLLPALLGFLHPQLTLVHGGPLFLPRALAHGVGLGVGLPIALSLPSLTQVFQVSPLSALRSAAVPLTVPKRVRWGAATAALAGLLLAAWLEARDLTVALAYAAGILALAALSFVAARSVVRWIGRRPRARLPALAWYGAAGLARPSAQTTGSIVALALGAALVLSIALLQELLSRELDGALPHDAPSVFLVDVQPDQWPSVAALAGALGATRVESAPVVMARLAALDGRPVAALLAERPGDRNARERAHRLLTREQRISWMARLPPDNQIVAGALWRDPRVDEVSLEQDFARDLGARVGSVLTFDVQGVPLDFTVTSLRSVRWRSFATNFFIVAEPGPLDDAPHFRLGALRLPREAEQTLQDRLAALYPNVTVLRVHELMAQVRALTAQSGLLVRLLGGLAMLTGVLVLVFGVAATQQRRAREAALLKALGASPRAVLTMFAIEYTLIGALAGALASGGAYVLTAALARYVLAFDSWPAPGRAALACGATIGLTLLGGLLASARALLVRPLAVLRQRT